MQLGLLTDSVSALSLEAALDHATAQGLTRVEFAAGNWSTSPHLDVPGLLADRGARERLLDAVADRGLSISALNGSGNQLHPVDGARNDQLLRDTIRLAGELGVDTVVLMSGLPAGAPGDTMPNWITTSWPPETTVMHDRQWNDVALPYWHDLAAFARAQEVSHLGVEMHANQLVYSVPGLLRLRAEIGPTVGANLDPSHLFWMGADPLQAVTALGAAIMHVHAKDTRIESRAGLRSLLDPLTVAHVEERAWNFVTVGRGHGVEWWATFMAALAAVGYDGTLSIEHEDAQVDGVTGTAEAAAVLQAALQRAENLEQSQATAGR